MSFNGRLILVTQGEGDVDVTGVGAGGIDVQLLSVCLAALMALFRLPELCREVFVSSLIVFKPWCAKAYAPLDSQPMKCFWRFE